MGRVSKHRDKQGSAEVRIREGGVSGEDFRVRGLARQSLGEAGAQCLQSHVQQKLKVQLEHCDIGGLRDGLWGTVKC